MTPADYTALNESLVVWHLPEQGVARLGGNDARAWLQGQATQDVWSAERFDTCLCTATGQLQAVLRVEVRADGLWVIGTHASLDVLRERVDRFVILEDVTFASVATEIWSVQGPQAKGTGIAHDRLGRGGYDTWERPEAGPMLSAAVAEIARVEALRPVLGIDTTAKTLPPELGPEFGARHLHYSKGCYMGQEVLMRIHARGHTNNTWRLVRTAERLAPGQALALDGREMGFVTSSATSPRHGHLATAMLRNAAANPGTELDLGTVLAGPVESI